MLCQILGKTILSEISSSNIVYCISIVYIKIKALSPICVPCENFGHNYGTIFDKNQLFGNTLAKNVNFPKKLGKYLYFESRYQKINVFFNLLPNLNYIRVRITFIYNIFTKPGRLGQNLGQQWYSHGGNMENKGIYYYLCICSKHQ